MQRFFSRVNPLLLACLAAILLLTTACGPKTAAAPTADQPATPTAALPAPATATALPPTQAPTATALPTQTALPTATPVPPTSTPQPTAAPTFGLAENGQAAWCVPNVSLFMPKTLETLAPPFNAKVAALKDNLLDMPGLPASACAFIYTFNQTAPAGLKLKVFELKQKSAWLTADLVPVPGSPNSVAAVLRHTYIVEPPFWTASYEFAVVDSSGNELRHDRVDLRYPTPKLCWNGQLPNLKTLRCPLKQDLHPWDPGYLTPIPTSEPGDE